MLKEVITDFDINGGSKNTVYDIGRFSSRGIVMSPEGTIAVLKADKNGYYRLPGGGIELDENRETAFIREIRETTGKNGVILAYMGTVEEHKRKTGFLQISQVFIGKTTEELKRRPSDKAPDYALEWLSPSDAYDKINDNFEQCAEYKQRFMLKRDLAILAYFNGNYSVETLLSDNKQA